MRFLAVLMLGATAVGAQISPDMRPGFILGTGVVVAPDPPGGECDGGTGGLEAKAGLVIRPRRPWVVELDLHSADMLDLGCAGVGRAVDTLYSIPRHSRYLNSTLGVGVETPQRFPLIRLSAGAGAFLSGRASPFAVFDAAWSTRGARARVFVEAQHTITRVDGVERHFDFNTYPPAITRRVTASAKTYCLRLGMELPFGQRSDR